MINHTNTQICGGLRTQMDHKAKAFESGAIGLRNLSSMNEMEKNQINKWMTRNRLEKG